jgi:hypothetical protein
VLVLSRRPGSPSGWPISAVTSDNVFKTGHVVWVGVTA